MREFDRLALGLSGSEASRAADELLLALKGGGEGSGVPAAFAEEGSESVSELPDFPGAEPGRRFRRFLQRLYPAWKAAGAAQAREHSAREAQSPETENSVAKKEKAAEQRGGHTANGRGAAAESFAPPAAVFPEAEARSPQRDPGTGLPIIRKNGGAGLYAGAQGAEAALRRSAGNYGSAAGDESGDMERLSDFFMRDSRRYDRGFERY